MNRQKVNETGSKGRYFLWLWLLALGVFIVFLIMALFSAPDLKTDKGKADEKIVLATQNATDRAARLKASTEGYIYKDLLPLGSLENPELSFSADKEYILVGAALQGFYQALAKEQVWSLNLPEYTLAVQLLERDAFPVLISSGVKVEWELDSKVNLPLKSGISLEDCKGEMALDEEGLAYEAIIPAHILESENVFNPYPIIGIRAFDSEGALIAETAITLGVAPDFSCANCHSDPVYGVLETHDLRNQTSLEKDARSGDIVYCESCHTGVTNKDGKLVSASDNLGISAAIHSWHAPYLQGMGEESCYSCHINLAYSPDDKDEGIKRMFMRDVHAQRGLNCTTCHGSMEEHSLALLQAEKEAGQEKALGSIARIALDSAEGIEDINPRVPWVQQPDCLSCHDFAKKPVLGKVSGFNRWTDRLGDDKALFSRRTDDTGQMRCISCHGSPHAIYPATNPIGSGRDNIQPMQYQQDARVLGSEGNCALCHTQAMSDSMHHDIVERSFTRISVPQGAVLGMATVRFSHDAHISVDCMHCHHYGHEDGETLRCSTSGCHDASLTDPSKPEEDYRYFRNAFHGLERSCNACHLEREQAMEAGGPTNCQGCHRAPSKLWAAE